MNAIFLEVSPPMLRKSFLFFRHNQAFKTLFDVVLKGIA